MISFSYFLFVLVLLLANTDFLYLLYLHNIWRVNYVAFYLQNDGKYRCSETGYRIPLRCEESKAVSKEKVSNKESGAVKQRSLLDNKSASKGGADSYITYRSCIPATNEEKISVLGFEVC